MTLLDGNPRLNRWLTLGMAEYGGESFTYTMADDQLVLHLPKEQ
jgi:hypothetical protein